MNPSDQSLLTKQISRLALRPLTNLLQGPQRDVLLAHLRQPASLFDNQEYLINNFFGIGIASSIQFLSRLAIQPLDSRGLMQDFLFQSRQVPPCSRALWCLAKKEKIRRQTTGQRSHPKRGFEVSQPFPQLFSSFDRMATNQKAQHPRRALRRSKSGSSQTRLARPLHLRPSCPLSGSDVCTPLGADLLPFLPSPVLPRLRWTDIALLIDKPHCAAGSGSGSTVITPGAAGASGGT